VVTRLIDAKTPLDIRVLAQSLTEIEEDLSEESIAEAGSRLATRVSIERDPALLRAYGDALGSLPVGALNAAQIESLDHVFAIPNAPCQIVTRVKGAENLGQLARQILNPLCSEDGWVQDVIALDRLTKQSIVHGTLGGVEAGSDADFAHLVVDDNDDEDKSSADAAAEAKGDGIEVDFNKLSQVIAGLRPKPHVSFLAIDPRVASFLLLPVGIILLWLGWRR
jgi:hypothetical protein